MEIYLITAVFSHICVKESERLYQSDLLILLKLSLFSSMVSVIDVIYFLLLENQNKRKFR